MFTCLYINSQASTTRKTIEDELSKYDFLKKYSYPIFLTKNGKVGNGTCFFYKLNGKIYVISNAHTFTGWNPLKKEIEYDFDSIQIKYPTKNNSGTGTIKMLWGRKLIRRFKMASFVNQIDLLGVPLDNLDPNGNFYFINDLIDPAFFNRTPIRVISFGYPSFLQRLNPYLITAPLYLGNIANEYEILRAALVKENPDKIDSMNFYIEKIMDKYYMVTPMLEPGRSGSPVFGEFEILENGKKKLVYKFMGVFFGIDDQLQRSFIIKPDKSYNYLQNILF